MTQAVYGNIDNAARQGSVSATSFIPSNTYRRDSVARTGGGQVTLSGDYTGDADATFEVEILNDTIVGTPIISTPVFVGVGNGAISSVAATGPASARTITITLTDAGTRTVPAYANFATVVLEAATAGAAGNSITIDLDRSGITATLLTDVSVPEDLSAGTNEYRGNHFDLGASTLLADGTVPTDARRIRFEHSPYIYRQYRKYINGEYVYSFSPALFENVPKGTRVYEITGSIDVTIDDGASTETGGNLSGVVTLFDFLSGIQSDSSIVSVDGVVSNDLLPGGMGAVDLNAFTDSYVRSMSFDGGRYVRGRNMSAVTVDTDAPTETVTVTCSDASIQGSEKWEIEGTVTGVLSTKATTNVAYTAGPVNFTILPETISGEAPQGQIEVQLVLKNDGDGRAVVPVLCEDKLRALLGARAQDGEYEFVYTPRPNLGDCDTISITGGPNAQCLGTEVEVLVSGLDKRARLRAEEVEKYFSELYSDEANPGALTDGVETHNDLTTFNNVRAELLQCLKDVSDSGDLNPDSWVASTAYTVGDIVVPATSNNYRYVCRVAGTSHSSEPTWPTTEGGQVVETGGVTWELLNSTALVLFDAKFNEVKGYLNANYRDASVIGGTELTGTWSSSASITAGDVYRPSTANGHLYQAEANGVTDSTEPTWPTDGGTVVDNTVTWLDLGEYWAASTSYELGTQADTGYGIFQVTEAGTSGGTEPTWANAGVVSDGGVTWTKIADPTFAVGETDELASAYTPEAYPRIVRAKMNEVRIAADLLNFDGTSVQGSGCWSDMNTSYWWVNNGDGLLPAFTHVYYHSSRRRIDATGAEVIESTQNFGFAPAIAGESGLVAGDKLVVTINNAGGAARTYQVGDRYSFEVTNATPIGFGGGQDGNDTLTWRVYDSVDGVRYRYELDLNSPGDYSAFLTAEGQADQGVNFAITEGAIPFELGDEFTFAFEGGQFQWRKNGGAWSAATQIASSVVMSDGVSAAFNVGKAPSFVDGDAYAFTARAVNGPRQTIQPTDGQMEFDDATTLTINNSAGLSVSDFLLVHSLPSGTSITVQGSDDNFSTTPLSESVTWRDGVILHRESASTSYAEYRIVITGAGTGARIQWAFAGEPWAPTLSGQFVASRRFLSRRDGPNFTGAGIGSSRGGTLLFNWMRGTNADDLESLLEHAFENDDCRIGFCPSANVDEPRVGYFDAEEIEFTDRRTNFEANDKTARVVSASIGVRGLV